MGTVHCGHRVLFTRKFSSLAMGLGAPQMILKSKCNAHLASYDIWDLIFTLGLIFIMPLSCAFLDKERTRPHYFILTGKADDLSLHRKFGCSYFTLACLLDFPKSADGDVLSPWFPNPTELVNLVRRFSGSIMSENIAGNADCFLSSTINLAAVLVRHGQYEAAQVSFLLVPLKFIKRLLFDVVLPFYLQ